jgi:tetratricopeptide (TPR) repeat protein
MRKIKIKVKHLILIIVILCVGVCSAAPKIIMLKADRAYKNDDIETSKVLYNRYIKLIPFGKQKAKAMFRIAEQIAPHEEVLSRKMFFSKGGWMSGRTLTIEIVDNAAKYYEKIYKYYDDSEYYVKSYKRLLDIYTVTSDYEEAMKLIDEQINSDNEKIKIIAEKYNLLYKIINNKYQEAEKIGKAMINEGKVDKEIYSMLGDMEIFKGNYEKANKYFEKCKDNKLDSFEHDRDTEIYRVYFNNYSYYRGSVSTERAIELYNGSGEIHGKVTINGKPLPNVILYLMDSEWDDYSKEDFGGYSINEPLDSIYVKTNSKGEYSIKNLHEGEYALALSVQGLLFSREKTVFANNRNEVIKLKNNESVEFNFPFMPPLNVIEPKGKAKITDGKVHLKWEEVKGVAYYRVGTIIFDDPFKLEGSSVSTPISDNIYNTDYDIDIEKLRSEHGLGGFTTFDDGLSNIQVYLGALIPGTELPITVSAYDEEGDQITTSIPIQAEYDDMILISVEGELTEGDKLLIDGKPEEALKYYEEYLKENPEDIYTLRVLYKMYLKGTRAILEKDDERRDENKDIHKAFELAQKIYEITNDAQDLKYVLGKAEYDLDNKEDWQWTVQELLKLPENELTDTEYKIVANLYLKLDNLKEADKYYDMTNKTSSDYSTKSVLLKIYFQDFNSAEELVKDDKFHFWRRDKEEFVKAIENLKTVDKSSESYIIFRELLKSILIREDGYEDKYKNENWKIKDDILNVIMKEVDEEYYISR